MKRNNDFHDDMMQNTIIGCEVNHASQPKLGMCGAGQSPPRGLLLSNREVARDVQMANK